jgi:hypothetical protein
MRTARIRLASVLALLLCAFAAPARAAERGADGRFDGRRSMHFELLQDVDLDRNSAARRFERDVLDVLERAYDAVGDSLGIRPEKRIQVRVYDPALFDGQFRRFFAFRAAGFYNGVVHVRGAAQIDQQLVRTLTHEYVHAAIGAEAGQGLFPAWLNEGLAEYFENRALGKRYLSAGEHGVLRRLALDDTWIPLGRLAGPSLTHLNDARAAQAYLQSYGMVDYMVRTGGSDRLERLCAQLVRSRNLRRAFDRSFGRTAAELEQAFRAELAR